MKRERRADAPRERLLLLRAQCHAALGKPVEALADARAAVALAPACATDARAAAGVSWCLLPGCGRKSTDAGVAIKACSKCHNAFYCTREHQAKHWATHKADCKRWRRKKRKK